MSQELLLWDVYEIQSDEPLNGVMLRGRIRKLGIEKGFNVLAENTADAENGVRFGVLENEHARMVKEYLESILDVATVSQVMSQVPNPVLSKLKVNSAERYTL